MSKPKTAKEVLKGIIKVMRLGCPIKFGLKSVCKGDGKGKCCSECWLNAIKNLK